MSLGNGLLQARTAYESNLEKEKRKRRRRRKTNPNPWKWVFITAAKVEGKSHKKLFHVWIIVSERQATEQPYSVSHYSIIK